MKADTLASAKRLAPTGAELVLITAYLKHSVRGGGPWWRLFRKQPRSDAPWHLYFEHQGKRVPLSLQTDSLDLAKETAKRDLTNYFEGYQAQFNTARNKPAQASASLQVVFDVVPSLAIRAGSKTRESYVWAVRWVLERAGVSEIPEQPAAILNETTARKFFVAIQAEAAKETSQAEQNRIKRTALQIFSFSAALVAPAAVESMRHDHKLDLPDFGGWRKWVRLGANLLQPGNSSRFATPPDAVLRRTLVEWVRLGRTPGYTLPARAKGYTGEPLPDWLRRNMFIGMGLMLACGLRKSEVAAARWDWFTERHGHPHLDAEVNVKNHSGRISVRPLDPYWQILNRICTCNGWRTGALCLSERPKTKGAHRGLEFSHGGKSDRTYWPFVHIGYLLRGLGWTTQKTNHALRDWSASNITMKYNLQMASRWCRHGQIATTEAHYSRFVNDEEMINPKRLAWLRWA